MAYGILVTFAGYPYTPSSLTLDNGLANLAGALATEGHSAQIADLNTISTMQRLFPESIAEAIKLLAQQLMGSGKPSQAETAELARLQAELERHQEREVETIAAEVVELVRGAAADFVGFKLWNGDGFVGSVQIAQQIKKAFPDVKLYAGGPQASWFRDIIYGYTDVFDAVCYGEGEGIIAQLADHATGQQRLEEIPGIICKNGSQVRTVPRGEYLDLASLPEPIYDESVYPALAGDEKIKMYVLDESRGCPYQCGFCTHPIESGTRLRTRPAGMLADDIERMWRKHRMRAFRFSGSSTPGSLMAEVADEILARDLDVEFASFGHFRTTDPQHFEKLRQAGLSAIFFGLESGCQRILDKAVRKGIDLGKIKETVQAAQDAGIFVAVSMIVPLPFDTEQTLRESLALLLDIRADSTLVQFPGLLPMTPWYEEPEQYNFEFDKATFLPNSLDYKIKLLFPPQYWDPLPYKLNGMAFDEFTKLTAWFAAELEKNGLLTGVPDDNALIAQCAGMSAREFRDGARLWCMTGDWQALQEVAVRTNQQACPPAG